jgi:hypothetical protein
MRLALTLLLTALTAVSAVAGEAVSVKPDAVSVVLYRDRPASAASLRGLSPGDESGLAMINEVRMVELPAGEVSLRFEGVADGIIPQSATVQGLPGRMREQNFTYDLLSPGALLQHMVGQKATVVRTDRRTGREQSEPVTIRSAPDGVVVQSAGGGVEALKCSGGPERLVFDHTPEGLSDRPTLSVNLTVPRAGRYQLKLSYLTVRLDWSADYVARLNPDGKTLDLSGWLTLSNRSRVSFNNASTAVVAGKLARQPVDLPSVQVARTQPNCWPVGHTRNGVPAPASPPPPPPMLAMMAPAPAAMAMRSDAKEIVVTARKRVEQTDLGDYKLYTLGEPTSVAAQEVKQVQFLHQDAVQYDKIYRLDVAWRDTPQPFAATALLRLKNEKAQGLGLPLPAGRVAIRKTAAGQDLFLGEPGMRDVPKNEPFELVVGEAGGVQGQVSVTESQRARKSKGSRVTQTRQTSLFNHQSVPVTVEVRDIFRPGQTFSQETRAHIMKDGQPVWRVVVPANDRVSLSYRVEFDG